MKLETLQNEMVKAWKASDITRKNVISGLIGAVKKAGIDNGCRDNIPETLVDSTILKELKTAREMLETCPIERTDLREKYEANLNIILEYAPVIADTKEAIMSLIIDCGIEVNKNNRGMLMKHLSGKCDMKLANQIVSEMLK